MKINLMIAKILAILYIIFISLFVFMHLLPTLFLIGALVFAWKKPFFGGLTFILIGIIFTFFLDTYESIAFFFISLPLFVIGGLFSFERYRK